MRATIAAIVLATAACSSSGGNPADDKPPVLTVTSPTRGTVTDTTQVTVTGTVMDDSPGVKVTVQGQAVMVAKDGSFSTTLTMPAGLSLIETHAIDKGGHDVRDVRAVLAQATATADGSQSAPIAVHASAQTMNAIATAMAHDAEGLDYTSLAQSANPIYNNGGCLGAVVNITDVSIGSIGASMTPQSGSLATSVTLNNITVRLHVSFRVACIGGSGTITVTASAAHINGDLAVSADYGTLTSSLPSDSIQLDGFNFSVSGIPGAITGLFDGIVQGKVQSMLADTLKSNVPPLVDSKLAGLFANPYSVNVLGHDTYVTLIPSDVSIDSSGLLAQAQTYLSVTDGESGMYAPIPATVDAGQMAQAQGLGLALAEDLVNEMFSGLWAAGALDISLPTSQVAVLAALLDPSAVNLQVKFSLPPMLTTTSDGKLQLAVGDMMVSVLDANNTTLQQIALSVTTTLSAGPTQSGKLMLTVGQPTLYADVVQQDPNATKPLSDMQVEGIVNGVWGLVGDTANQALQNLPMPDIAGVQLGAPTLSAAPGFVTADIAVQ
jgi:hypothetical protein